MDSLLQHYPIRQADITSIWHVKKVSLESFVWKLHKVLGEPELEGKPRLQICRVQSLASWPSSHVASFSLLIFTISLKVSATILTLQMRTLRLKFNPFWRHRAGKSQSWGSNPGSFDSKAQAFHHDTTSSLLSLVIHSRTLYQDLTTHQAPF